MLKRRTNYYYLLRTYENDLIICFADTLFEMSYLCDRKYISFEMCFSNKAPIYYNGCKCYIEKWKKLKGKEEDKLVKTSYEEKNQHHN